MIYVKTTTTVSSFSFIKKKNKKDKKERKKSGDWGGRVWVLHSGCSRSLLFIATTGISVQKTLMSKVLILVTLHHEMSRNVPDGRFRVFTFSDSKLYAALQWRKPFSNQGTSGRATFFFSHGGTTFGTFGKTCFKR